MNLAFNIFIRFCSLSNPHACQTYLAFSDFLPGYTIEICEQASRDLAVETLLNSKEHKNEFVEKTWCRFNFEQGS